MSSPYEHYHRLIYNETVHETSRELFDRNSIHFTMKEKRKQRQEFVHIDLVDVKMSESIRMMRTFPKKLNLSVLLRDTIDVWSCVVIPRLTLCWYYLRIVSLSITRTPESSVNRRARIRDCTESWFSHNLRGDGLVGLLIRSLLGSSYRESSHIFGA